MKILVAGDFCPQNRVTQAFENRDYESVLGDVKDIVISADYSIVNFECPICHGGEKPIIKQGPNLCCSEKGLEAVKWAGFKCVTLANNHFLDYGEYGVYNTVAACTELSVDVVGGGENINEAAKILYKKIGKKTLAIINCCEHEFSIATENSAGSNPLNPIQQYYAIQEARKKADRVLVIVHGGHEHFQLPSPRMVEMYRFFVDAGADAVVNHHQHCYSGYEMYNGKPIFYGLGNFCFDKPDKHSGIWTEGYMVSINFTDTIPSFKILPYIQCAEEPCIKLLAKDAFDNKLQKLNSMITNPITLKNEIGKYYSACAKAYSNILEPIQNRYYLGAKQRGWLPSLISEKRRLQAANYINCESHRDKILFYLNQK